MKKKNKIIVTLVVIAGVAAAIFIGGKYIQNVLEGIVGGSSEPDKVLRVPTNVKFDDKKNQLSWDMVDHATAYNVDINGQKSTVNENNLYYVPKDVTNVFKVQAIDTTGDYFSSDWSQPYTYTLSNEFSYSKVCAYLNDALNDPGYSLQKIVSAYVDNNTLYTNGYFKDVNDDKLLRLEIEYDQTVNSISDCIDKEPSNVRIKNKYDIANYDSASYLIKSDAFAEEMAEHGLSAYDFSVVCSQVAKVDNSDDFHVFATYKATNGSEVKYIQSDLLCAVINSSANEELNYTTKMLEADNLLLSECSFAELKGDEIDFAKSMESINYVAAQDSYKQNKYVVTNNNYTVTDNSFYTDDGNELNA